MSSTASNASGWQSAKQRAMARSQPLFVPIELTYRCNQRCGFCYNPRHDAAGELTASEWAGVFDELRALGTLSITLTGGEPLLYPDFFSVALSARRRGLALRIFTNGTLVDARAADALAALDPLTVEMSLHGTRAATHERATGVPGSFEATLRGFSLLKERGLRLVLKTPLTCLNEGELEEMAALVAEAGVPYCVDARMVPCDDSDDRPLAFKASLEGVQRLYRMLAAEGRPPATARTSGGVNCGVARITLAIDPVGDVYPCLQWKKMPLGNVRTTRLREMWPSSPERLRVAAASVAVNDRLLALGGDAARFPFCPAVALQREGDALAIGPEHHQLAAMAGAARRA